MPHSHPPAAVTVSGYVCKDPSLVTAEDFFFTGFDRRSNTSEIPVGSRVNLVDVTRFPGLNTLGVAMGRIDFGPRGLNPPHQHPRASEIFTVLEGTLLAGFVTSNPNRLFTKILRKGDMFAFPQGLIHFQYNIGESNAVALAAFNSQNPGVTTIANAVFGSEPRIPDFVLSKAFQLDKEIVDELESLVWIRNIV